MDHWTSISFNTFPSLGLLKIIRWPCHLSRRGPSRSSVDSIICIATTLLSSIVILNARISSGTVRRNVSRLVIWECPSCPTRMKKCQSWVCRSGIALRAVGTPEFMAPEIFAGEEYNTKADIYAFGMCLLEMYTQEIPFSECQTIPDVYRKVTQVCCLRSCGLCSRRCLSLWRRLRTRRPKILFVFFSVEILMIDQLPKNFLKIPFLTPKRMILRSFMILSK